MFIEIERIKIIFLIILVIILEQFKHDLIKKVYFIIFKFLFIYLKVETR